MWNNQKKPELIKKRIMKRMMGKYTEEKRQNP